MSKTNWTILFPDTITRQIYLLIQMCQMPRDQGMHHLAKAISWEKNDPQDLPQ